MSTQIQETLAKEHTLTEGDQFYASSKASELGKFEVVVVAGSQALVKQLTPGGVQFWIPATGWKQSSTLPSQYTLEQFRINLCQKKQ